jgi:ketosteroid isomerase-like protein
VPASVNPAEEAQIRQILDAWSAATRKGRKNDILANHDPDVLIYDVLAPLKYEGTAAYRASWDEWQPETEGEGKFDLEDLVVTADAQIGFAHGLLRCGGTMPDGRTFEDLVRATFCLQKIDGAWKIEHQHISKPIQMGGA